MSNLFNAFLERVESTPGLPLYPQPDDIIALKADPEFARVAYFNSCGAMSYLGRVLVVNSRALPLLPAVGSTLGVQSQAPIPAEPNELTPVGLELWLRELDGITGGCSLRVYVGPSPGSLHLQVSWVVGGKRWAVDRALASTTLRDMPPAAIKALLDSIKREVIRLVGGAG